jgi:YD repeat-containing protein
MDLLDPNRLERVAQAAIDAVDGFTVEAQRLAAVEVDGSSPDKRIQIRVTASGRLVRFRLRDGVIQRYDSSALGELVTRTIRDTQRRARDGYQRAVAALEPPEVAASDQELERIWRE